MTKHPMNTDIGTLHLDSLPNGSREFEQGKRDET